MITKRVRYGLDHKVSYFDIYKIEYNVIRSEDDFQFLCKEIILYINNSYKKLCGIFMNGPIKAYQLKKLLVESMVIDDINFFSDNYFYSLEDLDFDVSSNYPHLRRIIINHQEFLV